MIDAWLPPTGEPLVDVMLARGVAARPTAKRGGVGWGPFDRHRKKCVIALPNTKKT